MRADTKEELERLIKEYVEEYNKKVEEYNKNLFLLEITEIADQAYKNKGSKCL